MSTAVASRQADLDKILAEADTLQKEHEGKKWPKDKREKFEALCREGAELQEDIKAEQDYLTLKENGRRMREVSNPDLPSSRNPVKGGGSPHEIAGYVSLGDMVIASEAFQSFAKENCPRGHVAVVQIANAALHGKNIFYGPRGEPLVPLTRNTRKAFEDFLQTKEMKAVPTLGSGVIEPERITRIPQVNADQRLRVRDIISTGQTNSSSVDYIREEALTGDAGSQTPGQLKEELSVEYTRQSAPAVTIAGWMPVQNQQMEDWAQLRGLIDGRLRYAVSRNEEQQLFYGEGGADLTGLLNAPGIQDIATNGRYNNAVHTLIDVVRMGITDVFVAGYEPSVVALHPYDWETILLEKGSDDRYVWAVVTDNNGSRIWGLRVVESVGLASREAGHTIARREVLVGDFAMGAQLLDRMDLTVQVGLVDDQFIRNMRTILAEERIALPIYAPAAFAHFQTQAES